MYFISQLFVYPVKSLGGIALNKCKIEKRGLQYDRRWMLCNEQNQFISQREFNELALFKLQLFVNGFAVQYKNEPAFEIPFSIEGRTEKVKVWDDECEAIEYKKASEWFSLILNFTCKLFYMPNETKRNIDDRFSVNNEITSFSDGFPVLIIGQESLNDLNNKLAEKIEINRFRPNIVFRGGNAFDEDNFEDFSINNMQFKGVKLCSRCIMITINQTTGITSAEPLKTLATYRTVNNNVMFGKNVIALQTNGFVQVNDELKLL